MFHTFNNAKLNLPDLDADESVWEYVSLMMEERWFLADCQIVRDKSSNRTSFFLSNSKHLSQINASQNIFIKNLYLVSPPNKNESGTWKMEQINKVSTGVAIEKNHRVVIEVYELLDGKKFYSTDVNGKKAVIEEIKVIFSS